MLIKMAGSIVRFQLSRVSLISVGAPYPVPFREGKFSSAFLLPSKRKILRERASPAKAMTAQDQVLWNISKRATRGVKREWYLECLVRIGVDNPGDNNIPEHVKNITSRNRRPGSIVARYLGSSFDRKTWKNYKAWIEID